MNNIRHRKERIGSSIFTHRRYVLNRQDKYIWVQVSFSEAISRYGGGRDSDGRWWTLVEVRDAETNELVSSHSKSFPPLIDSNEAPADWGGFPLITDQVKPIMGPIQ